MNATKRLIAALLSLTLANLACNLPQTAPPTPQPDLTGTSIAATVEAQITLALQKTATPTASITPTNSATASPSITPTYSPPRLKINENTNCRNGPGENYFILVVLKAGESVEIIGKLKTNDYWVVKTPGKNETCWVWGGFSTASGSVESLPELTPPAPPTAAPPAAPRGLTYSFSCSFSDVSVNLSWTDVATNETGYRLLRNSAIVAELPANASAYSDVTAASSGSSFTYSIEAFNSAGRSSAASINFACP
jgi:hypothetical protein